MPQTESDSSRKCHHYSDTLLGDAIYASPTYAVDMLLHPWTREDGVTAPDFP
jgi:hypothetical protein